MDSPNAIPRFLGKRLLLSFNPLSGHRSGLHWSALPLVHIRGCVFQHCSASLALPAFQLLCLLLTSPRYSASVARCPASILRSTGEISRGKTRYLHCIDAGFTKCTQLPQMEDFAVTCPLVPSASRLLSGFCSSSRSFGLGFLQTPPRGDAHTLLLAFGSAIPGHRTFTDEVTRHARRTHECNRRCAASSRNARVDSRVGAKTVRGKEASRLTEAAPSEATAKSEAAGVRRRAEERRETTGHEPSARSLSLAKDGRWRWHSMGFAPSGASQQLTGVQDIANARDFEQADADDTESCTRVWRERESRRWWHGDEHATSVRHGTTGVTKRGRRNTLTMLSPNVKSAPSNTCQIWQFVSICGDGLFAISRHFLERRDYRVSACARPPGAATKVCAGRAPRPICPSTEPPSVNSLAAGDRGSRRPAVAVVMSISPLFPQRCGHFFDSIIGRNAAGNDAALLRCGNRRAASANS